MSKSTICNLKDFSIFNPSDCAIAPHLIVSHRYAMVTTAISHEAMIYGTLASCNKRAGEGLISTTDRSGFRDWLNGGMS